MPLIFLIFFSLSFYPNIYSQTSKKESEQKVIQLYFENWKRHQITSGNYLSIENCNWNYVKENNINTLDVLGIPSDITIHFGDINHDNKEDGIVCILPNQCDGGNGSMMFQLAILIVSTSYDYDVLEKYPSMNLGFNGSFYHIENIIGDQVKATYFEYIKEDGRCCPSIQRTVLFDFKDNFLFLEKEKIIME